MLEGVAAEGVSVHPDGVALQVKEGGITGRLLVDCMGNFGPIVRQVTNPPILFAVIGGILDRLDLWCQALEDVEAVL